MVAMAAVMEAVHVVVTNVVVVSHLVESVTEPEPEPAVEEEERLRSSIDEQQQPSPRWSRQQ